MLYLKEILTWDGPSLGHFTLENDVHVRKRIIILSSNNECEGIHRIPYGRTALSRQKGPKRPVFLQHGLLNSDADWLINPTDRALGNNRISFLFYFLEITKKSLQIRYTRPRKSFFLLTKFQRSS
jgi:hypothetical protein